MNYTNLLLKSVYRDKLEVIDKLLKIYVILNSSKKISRTEISFLSICILEDMNTESFYEIVLESDFNFKTMNYIYSMMNRLKTKGLLVKEDKHPRWRLSKDMQEFKNLIKCEKMLLKIALAR